MPDFNDIEIGNPNFFWLGCFAILAIGFVVYSSIARRRAIGAFQPSKARGRLNLFSYRRILSTLGLIVGIVFLAIALMDLRWGKTQREVPQKGLEIVFALDVSRSMLAEDASPNRLERAKQQINEMIEEMSGDRIGLVLFAGQAKQVVPLTSHYDDFRQELAAAGPDSIRTGGSQLGIAINAAQEVFLNKTNDHKTIVLFTDGEDQESQPVDLARKLHQSDGVRIFTVGLGDIVQGARIPETERRSGGFVRHEGQQVWSKLNGKILEAIATETNAAYIPAGTKRVDMASVYHRYIGNLPAIEFESAKINAFIPKFQWFAAIALAGLLLETWLTTGPGRSQTNQANAVRAGRIDQPDHKKTLEHRRTKTAVAALTITAILLTPATALAQSDQEVAVAINKANELLRQERAAEAIAILDPIHRSSQNNNDLLNYNLAVAHFRNSDFEAAKNCFVESAKSDQDLIAANSRYNLGNCEYNLALANVESAPETAIKQLQQAIQSYRSGLRLDRKNNDARKNIELAQTLINQLTAQQQPNSDNKNDNKNESADRPSQSNTDDREPQQNQQQKSESSDQNNQSQNNQSETDQQQPSRPDDSAQANPNDAEKPSADSSQNEPSSQSSDTEPSGKSQTPNQSPTDPSNAQPEQGGETNPKQPNAQDPASPQNETGEKTEPSAEPATDSTQKPKAPGDSDPLKDGKLTSANQTESPATSKDRPSVTQSKNDGLMTREEAMKLLQSVRDRDLLRRMIQERRQRSRRVPVEKDW